jgi:septal ring factor EnvC (AmiA/AmiB activator)
MKAATNKTKTVNANQKRLSSISKESKSLQKSLGAIRSFLLEYASDLNLTQFEIKYLQSTKKDQQKYERLKMNTQFTKNDTTCVYWVVRTLNKLEKETNK